MNNQSQIPALKNFQLCLVKIFLVAVYLVCIKILNKNKFIEYSYSVVFSEAVSAYKKLKQRKIDAEIYYNFIHCFYINHALSFSYKEFKLYYDNFNACKSPLDILYEFLISKNINPKLVEKYFSSLQSALFKSFYNPSKIES